MKQVTVSKLQIAQAKECVERTKKYIKGLDTIINMCELVLPIGQYNHLPDDYRLSQRKDMEAIIKDLIAMRAETRQVGADKEERAILLTAKRNRQLGIEEAE